jgi:hypothetical protein
MRYLFYCDADCVDGVRVDCGVDCGVHDAIPAVLGWRSRAAAAFFSSVRR